MGFLLLVFITSWYWLYSPSSSLHSGSRGGPTTSMFDQGTGSSNQKTPSSHKKIPSRSRSAILDLEVGPRCHLSSSYVPLHQPTTGCHLTSSYLPLHQPTTGWHLSAYYWTVAGPPAIPTLPFKYPLVCSLNGSKISGPRTITLLFKSILKSIIYICHHWLVTRGLTEADPVTPPPNKSSLCFKSMF